MEALTLFGNWRGLQSRVELGGSLVFGFCSVNLTLALKRDRKLKVCRRILRGNADSRLKLRQRAIQSRIARRGIDSSERLGRHRWVVERTLAWFARYRRLTVRYERRANLWEAFHHLAASLISWRFVQRFC